MHLYANKRVTSKGLIKAQRECATNGEYKSTLLTIGLSGLSANIEI